MLLETQTSIKSGILVGRKHTVLTRFYEMNVRYQKDGYWSVYVG